MAKHITKENVVTGSIDEKFLIHQLNIAIDKATQIDLVVSFLRETGVYLVVDKLKGAIERGVKIRVLTTTYLNITQPSAIFLLKKELGDSLDIRFFKDSSKSFHAKAYFFKYQDSQDMFIGSSNLSRSALTTGVEWNYRVEDLDSINEFRETFESMFSEAIEIDEEVLDRYTRNWKKPQLETNIIELKEISPKYNSFSPRGAQIEALWQLEKTRGEGADKALVFAATGVGKTLLAAFDCKQFKAKKVLFVAHKQEILRQAEKSFKNVFGDISTGFYDGDVKNPDADFLFASVATLGKEIYLEQFEKDRFDYIIIDEFHHAAAKNYLNIINYFTPKFLLGLTATPDRTDGKDIYTLCDYNVVYEINLFSAINRGLLTPFRYYGIYDDTDYSKVRRQNGRYGEEDLNLIYLKNKKRNKLILGHYNKHAKKHALAFCATKKHASEMARYFNDHGVKSAVVHSGTETDEYKIDREEAIKSLVKGSVEVIFVVDMFNEGVDIPNIDLVMFLRPTESAIVFLQQLGRGLRLAPNKQFLTVLDFIGNYKMANKIPSLVAGSRGGSGNSELPEDCIVDFDLELIDLFKEIEQKNAKKTDIINAAFDEVIEKLGKTPSRCELFMNLDNEIYDLCLQNTKINPFKHYNNYLKSREIEVYEKGSEIINYIETTRMSKVYKMPILKTFIAEKEIKKGITEEEALAIWKDFFAKGTHWKDLKGKGIDTKEDVLRMSDEKHMKKINDMPVKHLKKSGVDVFKQEEFLEFRDEFEDVLKENEFKKQFEDALEYRILNYNYIKYKE